MARRDAAHTPSRRARRATSVLVVALLLVAGAVYGWRDGALEDLVDGVLEPAPSTPTSPAEVAPPDGLDLPEVAEPDAVAAASARRSTPDPAAIEAALAPYLTDPDLGGRVLGRVEPLAGARPASTWTRGGGTGTPASLTKVVTTTAALLAMDPATTFATTAVATGGRGTTRQVVLVGGGDPFLERAPRTTDGADWPDPARADLRTLAERTAAALTADGVTRVRLGFDDSLFTGPAVNPSWEADYVPEGVVSPTSALWVDEGRTLSRFSRVSDPAAEAGAVFARALRREGLQVPGAPTRRTAPADARELARVESAPLSQVVERVLQVSDNEAAEVLLRHVGLAADGTASTAAGRRAVRRLLAEEGVRLGDSVFDDGSGLSRANLAEPRTLVDVLRLAASEDHPDLRAVVTGLPVAGFDGSLADRLDEGPPAALGRVRAKTGTLTGVTSLAGLATDRDGEVLVFVLLADRITRETALTGRQALDAVAGALGACRCAS